MAALFDGTISYLVNPAPQLISTGYPCTFGIWLQPSVTPAAFGTAIQYTQATSGSPTGRFDVRYQSTGKLTAFARNAATTASANSTTSLTNGSWHYVIARFISATNRRLSILFPTGLTEHVQDTTSITLSGMDSLGVGATINAALAGSSFWQGSLAEAFVSDFDVQADGAQLDDNLLRQLAYHGPFSVPYIAASVVEYHAMNSSLPSVPALAQDYSRLGTPAWTNTAVSAPAVHPPLPYEYDRPRPVARMLMI